MRRFRKKNLNKHLLIKTTKKSKFKRQHKGKIKGLNFAYRNTRLCYGRFGIKILNVVKLTRKHIEAFRMSIARKNLLKKKKHKLWVRGLFNTPVSKKPNEIRMGKGKGPVDHWIMKIKPGKIIAELSSLPLHQAKRIEKIMASSLGCPTTLIVWLQKLKIFRFIKKNILY